MSKKPLTTLLAVGLLGASASAAVAMPSADDKCAVNIKHPANTAGLKFSEDCKQVYVLPPTTGKVALAGLARNANLQFCPAVLDVHTTSTSIMNSAGTIAEKIEKMIADFEPQAKEIEAMRIEVAELEARRAVAKSKFDAAADRRQELVMAVNTARADLNTCLDLNTAEDCEGLSDAVEEAKADLKTFTTNEYRPAETAFNDADLALAPVKKKLNVKTAELAEATTPLFDLYGKLVDLNASVMALYKEYAALEGATGQLTYSIQWDGLLKKYQDLNGGLQVLWRALPIKKATISMTSKINRANTTLPAVLWVSIPGSSTTGPVVPAPTEGAAVTPVSSTGSTVEDRTLPFGGSASAQVGLSLTGACPLFPSGLQTVNAVSPEQLTTHVVANATYTFEVKAKRAYTATYHMANFVSRLEKVTKKGGFFTSKNVHEIVEDASSRDWFSLSFDANSAEHQYTSQEKANITKEVKAQLIERALANIAVANGMLKPGVAPPLPGLLPTGASQVAQYMASGCGWNPYCRVGSYVLLGLNSVFGRQQALSSFKRNNSTWATERVVDYAVFEHGGAMSFVP